MLFKTSLLAALFAATYSAHAAGLGKLTVYSAIGQPLNAELALNASAEELRTLSARIASPEAFRDAGIDYMPVLASVKFTVAQSATGQPVLRLSSDRPINEPFLHFLVELNWTAGRMVREYTFLLDPPEMVQATKPASVVAPVTPKVQEPDAPATIAPREPSPAAPVAGQLAGRATGEVKVKPGDTLSKIAREHKPETVSLDQMLVALFNSNPDAFVGNNMNRLRAGKILRLPDEAEVAGIDKQEARQTIVAQAADFNAYRRRLAEAAGTAAATEAPAQQQVAGRIAPRVEEKAPPAPPTDKLEVSRTEAAKGTVAVDKRKLEEELVARDKALREASERIAQLEKNLENLKQLVELKSQAGAQLQQQAKAAAASAPAPTPAQEQKPEPAAAPAKPAEPAPAAGLAPESAKPATPPAAAETPKPAATPPAEPVKAAPKKPAPPPPPPPETSFVDENPEIVFGGGGILVLLLGYFGYAAWRKKKQSAAAAAAEEPSAPVQPKPEAAPSVSVAPAAGEEVSVLGDFSESSLLTTEQNIDPVEEADVLMAYGRDQQAEEILLEGLKKEPTRPAIHAKLLELYANRKDVDGFESHAKELHELTHGAGPEWSRATSLAQSLGISGGLFAAAAVSQPTPAAAEPPALAAPAAPAVEMPAAQVESVPAAQTESEPTAEAELGSLDFDLDLGTTSMPAAAAAADKAAQAPAAAEVASLDFDFDLGIPTQETVAPAAAEPAFAAGNQIDFSPAAVVPPPVAEAAPAAAVAMGNEISFDLDLGSGQPPESEPAKAVAEKTGGLDFDLDLGSGQPPESEPAKAVAETGGLGFDLDLGSIEQAGPAAPEMAASAPAIELPDISLDLELPPSSAAEAPALDLALPEVGAAEATPPAGDNPDAATKLELAQAYEEMGDLEGARELLNEVLNEGSPAQQEEARARLDRLSA